MKGRLFITIIGVAVMLASVNLMAQDGLTGKVKVDFTYSGGDITIPGKLGWINDDATTAANTQTKVAVSECTSPHGLVGILGAVLPFYQTYAAMSVYNHQIDADQAIGIQEIISTNQTNQLFYNAAIASPWAPYILGGNSMSSGLGTYGSSSLYGNMNLGALASGASNPKWN
ncbi:MAG: hypothetical protein WCQ53_06530 [bacterium]